MAFSYLKSIFQGHDEGIMKIRFLIAIFVMIFLILSACLLWRFNHDDIHLKKISYNQLPGWEAADTTESMKAFNVTCKSFLKQDPDTLVGSLYITLKAKNWYSACRAALLVDTTSNRQTKAFFEHYMDPVEFFNYKPVQGLFTGYYLPLLHGSLTKTKQYNVPIYRIPDNLITVDLKRFDSSLTSRQLVGRLEGNKLVPFYTREEINKGMISASASVILWVDSHIDRLFMEIEGSGIVQLTDGSQVFLGYAGQNGASYTAVGHALIQKGVMNRKNQSMQRIRAYLESHPEDSDTIINQNKSFVFFEVLPRKSVVGVKGIVLTPGYSLAIDRQWVPIGVPVWLNTTRPDDETNAQKVFQRLMIAQDTGGAIRGMVRGDVFWGEGNKAMAIAGKMNNVGYYWLLLPKEVVELNAIKFTSNARL